MACKYSHLSIEWGRVNPVGLYTFQNPQLQLPLQELLEDHFRVIVEQKMGIILG